MKVVWISLHPVECTPKILLQPIHQPCALAVIVHTMSGTVLEPDRGKDLGRHQRGGFSKIPKMAGDENFVALSVPREVLDVCTSIWVAVVRIGLHPFLVAGISMINVIPHQHFPATVPYRLLILIGGVAPVLVKGDFLGHQHCEDATSGCLHSSPPDPHHPIPYVRGAA